jgi:hypothetical protein
MIENKMINETTSMYVGSVFMLYLNTIMFKLSGKFKFAILWQIIQYILLQSITHR